MKTDQMTFRCTEAFKPDLDLIRKAEVDLPSRTEMLHRLVNRASLQAAEIVWIKEREAIGDTET